MLKLGAWKPQHFFAAAPDSWLLYVYYRLSRSRISLRLLRECTDVDVFERLMRHVRLSNGVARTTSERRFQDLDLIVNRLLSRYFSFQDELLVEDWAASACLASRQWAESLFQIFPQMRFSASDLALSLIEIEDQTSRKCFIVEEGGRPLQYVRPPFVIRLEPPEPWSLLVNRLWYHWACLRWRQAKHLWPLSAAWLNDSQDQEIQQGNYRLRKLPLIHPRAIAFARSDVRFAIRRHSVFDPAETPCHVIRTMNILNRAYFTEQELSQGVQSVIASLRTGGIWIVGRTIQDAPPVHNATIFRKEESGNLELLERIGEGSEIDSIALKPSNVPVGVESFA